MSTTTREKTVKLAPFKPEHYRLWKLQAELTLQVHNLHNIVLGREPIPSAGPAAQTESTETPEASTSTSSTAAPTHAIRVTTPALQRKIQEWERRHTLAHKALVNALEPPELIKVSHLKTAHEIWTRLQDEYGHISQIQCIKAENDLHALIKTPPTPMKDHIQEFTRRQEEVDYQRPGDIPLMTNTQINLAFMRSLGDDWKVFHQALGDRVNTLKPAELYAQVLAYDEANDVSGTATQSYTPPAAQALQAFRKTRFPQKRRYGSKPRFLPRFPSTTRDYNPKEFCRYCRKPGHNINECFKKKYVDSQLHRRHDNNRNRKYDPRDLPNGPTSKTTTDNADTVKYRWKANVAHYRNSNTYRIASFNAYAAMQKTDEWYLDSCCNVYIMPKMSRFDTYTPFSDKQEVIGLGGHTTRALGHGTVTLVDNTGHKHTLEEVFYVPDAETPIIPLIRSIRDGWQLTFPNVSDITFFHPSTGISFHGNIKDDILLIEERHSIWQRPTALQVTTRASRKRQLEENQNLDNSRTNSYPETPNQPISEPNLNDLSATLSSSSVPSTPGDSSEQSIANILPTTSIGQHSEVWHLRLGHAAASTLSRSPLFHAIKKISCDACHKAKQHTSPFRPAIHDTTQRLELVHSDICGPFPLSIAKS